jgi:hypothetical protein
MPLHRFHAIRTSHQWPSCGSDLRRIVSVGRKTAAVHLESLLLHHQVIVPITGGDLDLGPWQEVFYAEFDGQRRKRVLVKIIGLAQKDGDHPGV